ncbi:hypothetical protein C8R43DRAFT_952700 [Mycena crocata]|nr:hypothetical protein C8R43DRAFT_952700 [Mycena crocata]
MAKTTSSGNKRGKRGRKASIDSKTFRPGFECLLSCVESAESPMLGSKTRKNCADIAKRSRNITLGRFRPRRTGNKRYVSTCLSSNADARRQRLEQAAKKKQAEKKALGPATGSKERSNSVTQPQAADVRMTASQTSTASDPFSFNDPRARTDSGMAEEPTPADSSDLNAAVASAASPTSAEFVASRALAQLANGVVSPVVREKATNSNNEFQEVQVNEDAIDDWRAASVDSILEKANQLSSARSDAEAHRHTEIPPVAQAQSALALAVRRGELPPGLSPLTRVQQAHLKLTGDIGWLTRIQSVQLEVVKMNLGVLPATLPEHVAKWRTPGTIVTDLWDASDLTKKELATYQWRRKVSRDVQRARLNCEKHEGVYELDLEE